ncbi:pyruvate, phosphate dikinase [bacterium]|nr:pyruvate, phosphate dikinase [bacterium]
MDKKFVYFFGGGKAEGNASQRSILGGKGANLAEMTNIGIPVPPGFTISAEMCDVYFREGKIPQEVDREIDEHLNKLEQLLGTAFGSAENPLLVSVRSGAAQSMPGMMDSVLNLGMNKTTIQAMIRKSGNERFVWDGYRRFINMFGDVVMGIEHEKFEHIFQQKKDEAGVKQDTDLDTSGMKDLCERYLELYQKTTGESFPDNPREQLSKAIEAVFKSWNNPRAVKYREINHITDLVGTAVNVQTMVFGNMGSTSGTGVLFSRNPSTGEKKLYGEYLMNAQGEDVVAGIRTPHPIEDMRTQNLSMYDQILEISNRLEKHYKEMQDMEFTIQEGTLYFLQTRTGKRTAPAAVKIAVDMVEEGLIDRDTALMRIEANQLDQLLHPMFDPSVEKKVVAQGLPASPGAASGRVVFTAEDAEEWAAQKEKVILVRIETSPEDIGGMNVSQGILTARGGMTSHAAVVARGMGKCCVAGCGNLNVNYAQRSFSVGGVTVKEGDWISLDGTAGEVMLGKVPTIKPELTGNFARLMNWADEVKRLKVKTNADNPRDSQVARDFGAQGIGLCRTEHMFFEGDRIKAVREMILSKEETGRKKALDKLLPMQKEDFKGIFKVMDGLPVIIRLLDPPLHEFLPKEEEEIQEVTAEMGVDAVELKALIESMHEFNPMLGFRGCRLGVSYPEITEMQARAILEAAVECRAEGIDAIPQIEVPLIGNVKEFALNKIIVERVAGEMGLIRGKDYWVGTMIEVPRAAITADEIAPEVDFMSFGTNDLTQMGCGFSRDDAGKFLKKYVELGIYDRDPFQTIDQAGVGKLMKICVDNARKTKPQIEIGICGEHGGEPASVEFCHKIGLNDVSCSPYRVPIARLAAAQAAIKEKQGK